MNHGTPNQPSCQLARESLVELFEATGRVHATPAEFHCGACRDWFERARTHANALSSISRKLADIESLDGLVVAELNAGRRQERAASVLRSIKRLDVPAELEVLVRDGLRGAVRGAPHELERRVAFELASGAGPRAERRVGSMARLAAPAELDALVARSMAYSGPSDSLPLRRWIAVAAVLFVLFGAAAVLRQSGVFQSRPYNFRVVRNDSTASLDPLTRSLLSATSSGWYDVPGVAR